MGTAAVAAGAVELVDPEGLPLARVEVGSTYEVGDAVGISWLLKDVEGTRLVSHGGTTNGQYSDFVLVPSRGFGVTCLSNCDHGCAAAISAPGKWTYLLGRLDPLLAPDLLAYAAAYAAAKTGTVLPSKRPASLARMVLGRVPDLAPTPAPAPARKELAA